MCTHNHDDDDDLNDDLSALFNAGATSTPRPLPPKAQTFVPVTSRMFTETCPKCGGTGSWHGRGQCFTCKGTGKRQFKSAPEQRQKARTRAHERKAEARQAFADQHQAEIAWVREQDRRQHDRMAMPNAKVWDFPIKMSDALTQWGTWTDNQLAAIRKCMARDAIRKEQWAQERTQKQAAQPTVDTTLIEQAFHKANEKAKQEGANGIMWPKLRLDTFTFAAAPATDKFPAAIFVNEGKGENRRKLGRISRGKFIRSTACDDATEQRILAAIADPRQSAIAFGQKFGACSVCGRTLTNKESIDAGIGPICAERFGF